MWAITIFLMMLPADGQSGDYIQDLQHENAEINIHKIAIVSAIGSDMNKPGLLLDSVAALAEQDIEVLAIHQTMRLSDIQFMIYEKNYEDAIRALHSKLIEDHVEKGQMTLVA